MSEPICDFYCDKILTGILDVPVCFENERVFAFHHTNPLWEHHVVTRNWYATKLLPLSRDQRRLTLSRTKRHVAMFFETTAEEQDMPF